MISRSGLFFLISCILLINDSLQATKSSLPCTIDSLWRFLYLKPSIFKTKLNVVIEYGKWISSLNLLSNFFKEKFSFLASTHELFVLWRLNQIHPTYWILLFYFFSFLPGVLGPSLCLAILLTVYIEDPVASDVHLKKKFWLSEGLCTLKYL